MLSRVCLSLLISISLAPFNAVAGKLDSFEDSVSDAPEKTESRDNTDNHNCGADYSRTCEDDDDGFLDIVVQIVAYGGVNSFDRVSQPQPPLTSGYAGNDHYKRARAPGEPLIPFFRQDVVYQPYTSGVSTLDYRFEAGYAAFAFAVNRTNYMERDPNDSLTLTRIYGAYRMSFGSSVELDLGAGTFYIEGNDQNSYSYFTMPVLIHPWKMFGFEFRPAWAGNVSDHDMAVLINHRFFSLKLGYRILATHTQSLKGPYFGISARY